MPEIISRNMERKDKGVVMEMRIRGARVLIRNDAYLEISPEEHARRMERARQVAQEIVDRDYMRMLARGEWDGKAPAPPLKAMREEARER